MPKIDLPSPTMTLTKAHARRFMLAHHGLWPPRQLQDKAGVVDFFRRVGCIQFDPIDVVGRNPDLVLHARVANCGRGLLDELLYTDRLLWDGWDKVASIYLTTDWPCFARYRTGVRGYYDERGGPSVETRPDMLSAIRERGPLSSIDFKNTETLDWFWGRPASVAKAALDALFEIGELGIHHRVANRRVFDLTERLLPADLLEAQDPNETDEAYQSWHVLRRVGSLGLANPSAAQCWQSIVGVNGAGRRAVLTRLVERGDAVAVAVEDVDRRMFFVRAADLPTLEAVRDQDPPQPRAAFIAPLDNVIWDRDLVRWVFDFDYTWEVYKPKAQRKYAYYVLPVLYGDRFVARFEPAFDKKTRDFRIANWWWEESMRPDGAVQAALADCLRAFVCYLDASQVTLGENLADDNVLRRVVDDV